MTEEEERCAYYWQRISDGDYVTGVDVVGAARAEALEAGRKAQSQVPCMHYAAVDAMQRAVAASADELAALKAKLARVEALNRALEHRFNVADEQTRGSTCSLFETWCNAETHIAAELRAALEDKP